MKIRIAALLLAGLGALPLAGAPAWHELEAPEFTVISQLSEKNTRAWAEEFGQFIEALQGVIPMDPRQLPPLTVVLFANAKEFAPFLPRGPDGQPIAAAGFFSRQNGWAIIGLANRFNDEATRQIIFHEGVHWCMSRTSSNYPLWLNEGLAEVFSTFRVESGHARWGDPLLRHLALLRSATPLPLQKLLAITRDDPLYYQKHRIGIFYAESWAFVHYLLFGRQAGSRADMFYYVDAVRSGQDPEKAFEVAFGTSYAGMNDDLMDYMRTGSYGFTLQRLAFTDAITAEFKPVPPRLREVTLEKLALCSGRNDTAREHASPHLP